jgi:pheromone shutdown protein TraB
MSNNNNLQPDNIKNGNNDNNDNNGNNELNKPTKYKSLNQGLTVGFSIAYFILNFINSIVLISNDYKISGFIYLFIYLIMLIGIPILLYGLKISYNTILIILTSFIMLSILFNIVYNIYLKDEKLKKNQISKNWFIFYNLVSSILLYYIGISFGKSTYNIDELNSNNNNNNNQQQGGKKRKYKRKYKKRN